MKKQIGYVPVDSGTLCIVDPCYLIPGDGHHPLTVDEWTELIPALCRKPYTTKFNFSRKHGTGIMFGGFGGDSCCPVFVETDDAGRVVRLTVEFQEQQEHDT